MQLLVEIFTMVLLKRTHIFQRLIKKAGNLQWLTDRSIKQEYFSRGMCSCPNAVHYSSMLTPHQRNRAQKIDDDSDSPERSLLLNGLVLGRYQISITSTQRLWSRDRWVYFVGKLLGVVWPLFRYSFRVNYSKKGSRIEKAGTNVDLAWKRLLCHKTHDLANQCHQCMGWRSAWP